MKLKVSTITAAIKKHPVGFALFVLGIALAILAVSLWNPSKTTNPNDARFDPLAFRLHNYDSDEDLYRALTTVFPPPTSKHDVERVLVQEARYRALNRQSANHLGEASAHLVRLSELWNAQNYYIDYLRRPPIQLFHRFRKSGHYADYAPIPLTEFWWRDYFRTIGVRVLYDGSSDVVLEIHILKFVQNELGQQLQLRNPAFKREIELGLPVETSNKKKRDIE